MLIPTVPPEPTATSGGLAALPTEPDTQFTIELTQAEINEYLKGETFQDGPVTVKDARIVLTPNQVVCSFLATDQESGLSADLTVRGVPMVSEGMAYFKIEDITLGESVRGIARLIAKALIARAMREHSTPLGIPIPIEEVQFQEIRLMPGKIVVIGRTR